MTFRNAVTLFICLTVAVVAERATAQNPEADIVKAIRRRENSIESYRLSGRRTSFEVSPETGQMLRQIMVDNAEAAPGRVQKAVLDAVKKGAPGFTASWTALKTVSDGERFHFIESSTPGVPEMDVHYNGERFLTYTPDTPQMQIDIYPEKRMVYAGLLEDRDIALTRLWEYEHVVGTSPEGESQIAFHVSETSTTVVTFDEKLTVRHIQLTEENGKPGLLSWHLGSIESGTYTLPSFKLTLWPNGDRWYGSIEILDDVAINVPIDEEEIAAPQPPLWATVVDHRYTPYRARRLMPPPGEIVQDLADANVEELQVEPAVSLDDLLFRIDEAEQELIAEQQGIGGGPMAGGGESVLRSRLAVLVIVFIVASGAGAVFVWRRQRRMKHEGV